MRSVLEKSEALRQRVTELLEEDTQVYARVMECYRMPRKTDDQKVARTEAMQAALKEAAEVPLELAERCAEIVDLALPAAQMGNKWAVSDAGVGVLLAEACMHGALLNVYVNLSSIQDKAYVQQTLDRIEEITCDKTETKNQVWEAVRQSIS
jgi:formiminotetrahydrofolate cyclodeaminase